MNPPAQEVDDVVWAEDRVVIAHQEPADVRQAQPEGLHNHSGDPDVFDAVLGKRGNSRKVFGDLQME